MQSGNSVHVFVCTNMCVFVCTAEARRVLGRDVVLGATTCSSPRGGKMSCTPLPPATAATSSTTTAVVYAATVGASITASAASATFFPSAQASSLASSPIKIYSAGGVVDTPLLQTVDTVDSSCKTIPPATSDNNGVPRASAPGAALLPIVAISESSILVPSVCWEGGAQRLLSPVNRCVSWHIKGYY